MLTAPGVTGAITCGFAVTLNWRMVYLNSRSQVMDYWIMEFSTLLIFFGMRKTDFSSLAGLMSVASRDFSSCSSYVYIGYSPFAGLINISFSAQIHVL
jgi:hypothetical protein